MSRRSDLSLGLAVASRPACASLPRTPRATFFTFVFPLILLVMFDALERLARDRRPAATIPFAQFFTPSIAIFAMTTGDLHGRHLRRRHRPRAGRVQARPRDAAADVRLPRLLGRVRPSSRRLICGRAHVRSSRLPAFGVRPLPRAPARRDRHARCSAAAAVHGARLRGRLVRPPRRHRADRREPDPLPAPVRLGRLLLRSSRSPSGSRRIAALFPLSHLVEAFEACFSPYTPGSGFSRSDLLCCSSRGASAGTVVAARRFAREATGRGGRRARCARPASACVVCLTGLVRRRRGPAPAPRPTRPGRSTGSPGTRGSAAQLRCGRRRARPAPP